MNMFRMNFSGGLIALGVFAILVYVLIKVLWILGIALIVLGLLNWLFSKK